MARIRSLKIGFFKNEHLAELSPWHRLLFEGLWLLADREGRLEDRPLRIKAEVFPYDSLDVNPLLADLDSKGFIRRYAADGAAYIAVVEFKKHQRPKSDEVESVIPPPPVTRGGTVLSEIPRGTERPQRGSPLGKDRETEDRETEREGNGADVAPPAADGADLLELADVAGASTPSSQAETFRDAWNRLTEPPLPRCREITSNRRRHIRARLSERPLTEWESVMARIQASAFCRGENERGWAASFDWLVGSPDVGAKVLEGKYDDRGPARRKPGATVPYRDSGEDVESRKNCRHEPRCNSNEWHQALLLRERTAVSA